MYPSGPGVRARPCAICRHRRRADIERLRVLGNLSVPKVAAAFDLRRAALARHFKEHVAPAARQVVAKLEERTGMTLLERLADLESDARRIARKAEAARDFRTAMAGVRELLRIAEFLGRLRGELSAPPPATHTSYVLVFEGGAPKALPEAIGV